MGNRGTERWSDFPIVTPGSHAVPGIESSSPESLSRTPTPTTIRPTLLSHEQRGSSRWDHSLQLLVGSDRERLMFSSTGRAATAAAAYEPQRSHVLVSVCEHVGCIQSISGPQMRDSINGLTPFDRSRVKSPMPRRGLPCYPVQDIHQEGFCFRKMLFVLWEIYYLSSDFISSFLIYARTEILSRT